MRKGRRSHNQEEGTYERRDDHHSGTPRHGGAPPTGEVERILAEPGSRHFISRLSTVEIQSVFALKVRTQVITMHDLHQLQKLIFADLSARRFQVLRVVRAHFHEAERLIRKHAPTKSF